MRGAKVPVAVVAPGTRVRDAEGRWTAQGAPVTVVAHVAAAASQYSSRSGQDRHVESGIVLLPRGTSVTTEHLIVVEGAVGVEDGDYRVEHVTRTAKHLRVLVRRHEAGGS
jgi:hypothetical protein